MRKEIAGMPGMNDDVGLGDRAAERLAPEADLIVLEKLARRSWSRLFRRGAGRIQNCSIIRAERGRRPRAAKNLPVDARSGTSSSESHAVGGLDGLNHAEFVQNAGSLELRPVENLRAPDAARRQP